MASCLAQRAPVASHLVRSSCCGLFGCHVCEHQQRNSRKHSSLCMPVAPCANSRFVVYRCVVLCGLSALIRHEESQCLLFVVLVVDSFCRNLAIARCERGDGDAISSLDITDKVTLLKRRLTAAEDLLEVTALGLQKTATEVCTGAVILAWQIVRSCLHFGQYYRASGFSLYP